LINLGDLPIRHTFRVVNNQLVLDDLFGAVPTRVIADNIVQLKAQYGRDDGVDNGTVPGGVFAADDGIVDNYTSALPVPPTPKDWQRNLSMRIAVVARSVLREKPSVEGGPCDTTTAPPRWAGVISMYRPTPTGTATATRSSRLHSASQHAWTQP
jgi:hypothetical protein